MFYSTNVDSYESICMYTQGSENNYKRFIHGRLVNTIGNSTDQTCYIVLDYIYRHVNLRFKDQSAEALELVVVFHCFPLYKTTEGTSLEDSWMSFKVVPPVFFLLTRPSFVASRNSSLWDHSNGSLSWSWPGRRPRDVSPRIGSWNKLELITVTYVI